VNNAVTQLDQMTQQNAALVEQSAAAAASLRKQAEQLAQAVAIFKLGRDESKKLIASAQATSRDRIAIDPSPDAPRAAPAPKTQLEPRPVAAPRPAAPPPDASGKKDDWEEF
jgi:methyl-accepting chemotaxis protein